MSLINNKWFWKQLAPKPYSSLWLWHSYQALKHDQQVYHLDDGHYYLSDSDSSYDYGYDDDDSQPDWLDLSLASLNQSESSLNDCIIQSIPVTPSSSVNGKRKQSKISLVQGEGYKKKKSKKTKAGDKLNINCWVEEKPKEDQRPKEKESIQPMKILDVNEAKSIIVLKKSPVNYFSIIYGDIKVTPIVGKISLDGYTLKEGESSLVSSGFGSYQIVVSPDNYQRYPTEDHLKEVLEESNNVPEKLWTEIIGYLKKGSEISDSIIICLEKWKWPNLTALRLLMKPQVDFSHWFHVSFAETRSPVVQWTAILDQLLEDVKKRNDVFKDPRARQGKGKDPKLKGVRIVICGGQNSGKSSLTRHLCNKILNQVSDAVHVVDCDPGQAEFTPPGLLNVVRVVEPILSPSFVNCLRFNRDIVASSSVGGVAIQNNPDLYLTSFLYLWKTFLDSLGEGETSNAFKPMIINTMGWTQGIGIHLYVDILRAVQPTHVIEIKRAPFDGNVNFPFDCDPDTINGLEGWLPEVDTSYIPPEPSCPSKVTLKPYLNYDYIRISSHHLPRQFNKQNKINRINNQLSYLCLLDEILLKNIIDLDCVELDLDKIHFHVQHEFPIDKHLIPHIIKNSWIHLCIIEDHETPLSQDSTGSQPEGNSIQMKPSEGEKESGMSTEPTLPSSNDDTHTMSKTSAQQEQDENEMKSSQNIPSTNESCHKLSSVIDQKTSELTLEPMESRANSGQVSENPAYYGDDLTLNLKILPFLGENICIGSAIVRDIDIANKKLILLTPEPYERIKTVNCIVRPQGIFVPDQLQ